MNYKSYTGLKVRVEQSIASVTIDHPPINLLDAALLQDLDQFGKAVAEDTEIRVVLFDSANPNFFLAHADLNLFLEERSEVPPKPTHLSFFHAMTERYRTLPQATIGIVEGRAIGGGSEFLLSLDMRFAARDRAVLGQFEAALGTIPGGSATQRLPRLVGRSRALEIILGCDEIDADTAELYGYVNRTLNDGQLRPFVQQLAERIATFPRKAIALSKTAVDAAQLPLFEGLLEEAHILDQTLVGGKAQHRMRKFLEYGGQTAEFELNEMRYKLLELEE